MTSRMRGKEFGVRSRKNTAERGSMRGERNREAEKMGREDAVVHATHIKTSRHQDSRHQDIKTSRRLSKSCTLVSTPVRGVAGYQG